MTTTKTTKIQTAANAKTATKAMSYADIQAQIAILMQQAETIKENEKAEAFKYFQNVDFSKLALLEMDDIIGILGNIAQYIPFSDSRIILNSQGVFIKDNKIVKENGDHKELSAKPIMVIMDASGNTVDQIMDRGPISEKLFQWASETIPEYSGMSFAEFKKMVAVKGIKKIDICNRISTINKSKFRMAAE